MTDAATSGVADPPSRPQADAVPIIVLIHGTYAANAEWVGEGSAFSSALRTEFPGAVIKKFAWDGNNDHFERIASGRALAKKVEGWVTGDATHQRTVFLIGHSHGGNVALYASGVYSVRRALAGTVFLGTPFLETHPRNVRVMARGIAAALTILIFFPILIALPLALWFEENLGSLGAIIAMMTIPISIIGFAMRSWRSRFYGWVRDVLEERLIAAKKEALDRHRLEYPPCPSFVGTVLFDEAAVFLRALDAFTHAPWAIISAAMITLLGGFAGLGAAVAASFVLDSTLVELGAWETVLAALGTVTIVALLLPLPVAVLTTAVRTNKMAFGGESLLTVSTVRIRPRVWPTWSDAPHSVRKRWRLPIHHYFRNRKFSLRHSFFYDDPVVIRDVVAWLRTAWDGRQTCTSAKPKAARGGVAGGLIGFALAFGGFYALSYDRGSDRDRAVAEMLTRFSPPPGSALILSLDERLASNTESNPGRFFRSSVVLPAGQCLISGTVRAGNFETWGDVILEAVPSGETPSGRSILAYSSRDPNSAVLEKRLTLTDPARVTLTANNEALIWATSLQVRLYAACANDAIE